MVFYIGKHSRHEGEERCIGFVSGCVNGLPLPLVHRGIEQDQYGKMSVTEAVYRVHSSHSFVLDAAIVSF